MKDKEKVAIQNFFDVVEELKQLEVIRSDKYLGDIGEFIAAHLMPPPSLPMVPPFDSRMCQRFRAPAQRP